MAKTYKRLNPHYLRRLLEQNFDLVKERSNDEEIVIVCPEPGCPDKTGNCSINVQKGIVHCWRCNISTHIVPFLTKHEIDFENESLEDFTSDNPIENLEQSLDADKTPQIIDIELPKGFTLLSQEPDSIYVRLIAQMAQRKHLYLQDFIDIGAGFTRFGEWEPFCIFPVYELNKLVYYQGRTYAPRFESSKTKRFPDKKDIPLGASNWLYGYDRIIQPRVKIVVIVESILNVLSLRWKFKCESITHVEPVAIFKHAISKIQMAKLLASSADEFCLMYDGDATVNAWEEAKKLSGNRLATVATMPIGTDANDDSNLAFERFNQREKFTPASALFDSLNL
jgi:hypothetical protein